MIKIKQEIESIIAEFPSLSSLNFYDIKEAPKKAGIYFIFDEYENLVYIGRSQSISIRLSQHCCKLSSRYDYKKDGECYWDSGSIIPRKAIHKIKFVIVDKSKLKLAEELYLSVYKTFFNAGLNKLPIYERARLYDNYIQNEKTTKNN